MRESKQVSKVFPRTREFTTRLREQYKFNLQAVRAELGYYQEDLAQALELPSSTISNLEWGRVQPKWEHLFALRDLFCLDSVDELFTQGEPDFKDPRSVRHKIKP